LIFCISFPVKSKIGIIELSLIEVEIVNGLSHGLGCVEKLEIISFDFTELRMFNSVLKTPPFLVHTNR